MSKISIVLYYWLLIAAALLLARTFGYADNNKAIIIILIVVTAGYAIAVMRVLSRAKHLVETDVRPGQKSTASENGVKRKKKKK